MAIQKRKANTTMVVNPNRGGLLIGSRRSSARKVTRTNPVKRVTAAAKANPKRKSRRRRNPASTFLKRNPSTLVGTLTTAAMTAVGVTAFDLLASRFPVSGFWLKVGVKLGGAWTVLNFGHKVPGLGKYKNEIALVLATLGLVDVARAYLVPPVNQVLSNFTGGALSLIPAPAAATLPAADTMGGYYGSWANGRAVGGRVFPRNSVYA